MSEHERGQMAGKQGEVGETKKALQALELKRREELRERDKKIVDMEKALAGEKKRREGVEARLAEIKGKGDGEVQEVKMRAKELEELAEEARGEVKEVKAELAALEVESSDERERLVVQLEQNRELLARVAEEYGRLASSSVQLAKHSRVKRDRAALEIQVLRLERKLANAEGQVVELVSLLRHTKEENMFLRECLRAAEEEAEWCWDNLKKDQPETRHTMDLDMASIEEEIRDAASRIKDARAHGSESSCETYRLTSEALLFHYSVLDKEICTRETREGTLSNDLLDAHAARDAAISDLEAIRAEHGTAQQRIAEMAVALAESGAKVELLRGTLDEVEARVREEGSETKAELKREREIAQKLAAKVQQNKVAEDTLRAEIEQYVFLKCSFIVLIETHRLTAELTEAERYQTAYYRLVDEVGELVARNALAEDEADKLSRFNAEILGHNNPAQRIMYVDRIRKELAETKQVRFPFLLFVQLLVEEGN
jgi:chromosome segregation ATPase